MALDHRQMARSGSARERIIQHCQCICAYLQRSGGRIGFDVGQRHRFRDREYLCRTAEEGQRDLLRRSCILRSDFRQQAATTTLRRRKRIVAERAVGHHGDVVALAPRDYLVFNRALLQVIEHLVARQFAGADDAQRLVEIIDIEIADTKSTDLALLLQMFESSKGLGQRRRAAPMQQVAIKMIGTQPLQ